MPIWSTEPVDREPEIRLTSWSVRELPNGDRHFVGYNASGWEGRVSSRIETFDAAAMRGVTQSGRVYELHGPSGWNADAEYVWHRWCAMNGVNPDAVPRIEVGAASEPSL